MWTRQIALTPNGTQTLSKMPSRFVEGVYPKMAVRGKDGHLWCDDGKEYIDLIAGLGAISLGYADPDVNKVVLEQMSQGTSFSLPHALEADVSELLCSLVPLTSSWKFGKNGTDATLMAVRAAKAYTKREKVMIVHYHGCADLFESLGTRQAGMFDLSQFATKAIYNSLGSFEPLKSEQYACVIMQPMNFIYPIGDFLQEVQDLCRKTGTLLIFDETVTGGRFGGFTAQTYFSVYSDLTVMGKGIANGFPLSAVGGSRKIMQTFERDDFFASSTFGGECLSLAAAKVTLKKLNDNLPELIHKGTQIRQVLNECFEDNTFPGYTTRFGIELEPDEKKRFMSHLCKKGILVSPYANFVMLSHSEEDLDKIWEAVSSFSRVD